MASLNKVILLGNVGSVPEAKTNDKFKSVKFQLATNETWKDRNGAKRESTEWHICESTMDSIVNYVTQYISKGDTILVEGKLHTDSWTGENGKTMFATKVKVDRVQMVSRRKADDAKAVVKSAEPMEPQEEDLPF